MIHYGVNTLQRVVRISSMLSLIKNNSFWRSLLMTLPVIIPGYILLKVNRSRAMDIPDVTIMPLRDHVPLRLFVQENLYKHDIAAAQLAALGPILLSLIGFIALFILFYIMNYAYLNHVSPKKIVSGETASEPVTSFDTGRKYFPVVMIMALTAFLCVTCSVTKIFSTIEGMKNDSIAVKAVSNDKVKLVQSVAHLVRISPPSIDMRSDPSVCGDNKTCVSLMMHYPEEIKTYPHYRRVFVKETLSPFSKTFWQIMTPYGIIDPIDFWQITHNS